MDNNYEIFEYLKPDDNSKLSLLGKHDIEELIYYIDKFYLEYRNSLCLPSDDTFGVELESEKLISWSSILNGLSKDKLLIDWRLCEERSFNNGCELKSPILRDTVNDWSSLNNACILLSEYTKIGNRCGSHVHVGSQILDGKREFLLNFIRLWSVYEKVIYRFCYGEYLTHRPGILGFADMVAYQFLEDYNNLENSNLSFREMCKTISHNRKHQSVNFKNVGDVDKDTIEFRCANGTINPVIWQNNINLFVKMLEYSKGPNFDEDTVSKRCELINKGSENISLYKKVYLEEAIEFCDLIFNNNLDKVYFLRQYMKNYEIGTYPLEEARPFTRNLSIKNRIH